jgi:hypothetical protein
VVGERELIRCKNEASESHVNNDDDARFYLCMLNDSMYSPPTV